MFWVEFSLVDDFVADGAELGGSTSRNAGKLRSGRPVMGPEM